MLNFEILWTLVVPTSSTKIGRLYLRLNPKEKAKIKNRQKMWSMFDWYWPFKREGGGRYKTDYTSDKHRSKGIGYFRNNHSLNCNYRMCEWKRLERRRLRQQNKSKAREIMKVINGHNKLD